jgi:uncharacterized repeat protein (TIGR02543 family)
MLKSRLFSVIIIFLVLVSCEIHNPWFPFQYDTPETPAGPNDPDSSTPSATYTVTVTNGTGSGNYAAGATVTIEANAPSEGKQFKEWITSPAVTFINGTSKNTPNAEFTMPTQAVTAAATYEDLPPNYHPITVTSGDGGSANADVQSAAQGATITLTATANSGYSFKEWEVISGGITLSSTTSSTATFEMPNNAVSVRAAFEEITYTVTVTGGTGGGNYAAGATVTIEANAPSEGQQFKEWVTSPAVTFINGTSADSAAAQFTMPAQAVSATATYEDIPPNYHNITVTDGGGGVANADVQSAVQGATITLTATANSGYSFKQWEVISGGITLSSTTSSTATFEMPNNAVSVRAVFEEITYTVTVTDGTGSGNYAAGATVSITADSPPSGQQFKNWTTASEGVTFANANSSSTSFTMPSNAVSVTANFEAITYTVTFNSNNESAVAPLTGLTSGSTITAPAAPTRTDYIFQGWYKESGFTNKWNFGTDTVTTNITLYARWVHKDGPFALGDTGPGGGIIFYVNSAGFEVQGYTGGTGAFNSYTARYLEAAPADAASGAVDWSENFTLIAGITTFANNTAPEASIIGNGRKDTMIIVNFLATFPETDKAAQLCASYSNNGLSDWFLPSLGELYAIYTSGVVSGFSGNVYWSSSQQDTYSNGSDAWGVFFTTGNRVSSSKKGSPNWRVRAIRAF